MTNKNNPLETQIIHRTIVVGLVSNNNDELLLCRMQNDRGVFPGQWGLPGGGIEPNEKMEDALKRELKEELGIGVTGIKPAFFTDGHYKKKLPDGSDKEVYMIFLLFHCKAMDENIKLNDEFSEYRWVKKNKVENLDLNIETVKTLKKLGWKTAKNNSLFV